MVVGAAAPSPRNQAPISLETCRLGLGLHGASAYILQAGADGVVADAAPNAARATGSPPPLQSDGSAAPKTRTLALQYR